MTRQVLIVVGIALLSFGGIGIVVGLAWLTASHLHGTIPYVLDSRAEMLVFTLPALLLVIAIIGAAFVAGALAAPRKNDHPSRTPHNRMGFRT
jgi:ABC-type sulfate transport system permease subunit